MKLHKKLFIATKRIALAIVVVSGLSACEKEPSLGEVTYLGTCKTCHANGLNGAPIFGNKKMWSKRTGQGIPTLVEHASNGYGLMPAKGGNEALTTEEITAAVEYMVSQVTD